MTVKSAVLYVDLKPSMKADLRRSSVVDQISKFPKIEAVHVWFNVHEDTLIELDMKSKIPEAEKLLADMAKKLSLKLVGAPDISYSTYGDETGFSYTYSARAE